MVSKKELLLKSIRELLALNVSDKEIAMNLKEVGIDEANAKALILEARQPEAPAQAQEPEAKSVPFFGGFGLKKEGKSVSPEEEAKEVVAEREQATEDLAAESVEGEEEPEGGSEEIAEGLGFWDKSGEKKPAKGKAEKKAPFASVETPPLGIFKKNSLDSEDGADEAGEDAPARKEKPSLVEDILVSKLWEKGIFATVNQKLAEMEDLRRDLDAVLDKKVADASKREMEKIKVLFDSQRALLVSKVDSELEAKAKGFAEMIEMKLREMRGINKQIASQIETVKEMERGSKVSADAISQRLEEADKLKERILSSLNGELINTRSESRSLVEEMGKKLGDMDERINKTLQLENQIVEGLVKEAERRVVALLEEKSAEFSAETKSRIEDIGKLKDSFKAAQKAEFAETEEGIAAKLSLFEEMIGKNGRAQKAELAKAEEGIAAKLSLFEERADKKLEALDKLQKQISLDFKPEKFRQTMQELNEFKAQFVDAIKQNAESFNEGIKNLNQQSQVIERQFMLRAEKIDKKIAELDAFEKSFAKEMGLAIEKIPKKGSGK
ncbi:MAG: hypothetical protein WC634_00295 [archaeon]